MRANLLRPTLLVLLAALATVLAACGSGASDEVADLGPDPSSMVPADVPFYIEAVVRPEGDLSSDLDSALNKLLVTEDSSAKIGDAIDQALADGGKDLTYDDDIAGWLGPRAGVFLNGYDPKTEEVEGAGVIAITDADAAQSFLDKVASDGKAADYQGVTLKTDPQDDSAYGIDGDFLLVGSRQGVEDAIDAKDGENFADLDDAESGLEDVPDNSLFWLHADPQRAVDLVKASGAVSESDISAVEDQLAQFGDAPVSAWGTVTEASFSLGASAPAAENAPEPTDLLTTLPADAWLAFAGADIGKQIQDSLEQFKIGFEAGIEEAAPGLAGEVDPSQAIEDATGIDLERDVAWIGDVGGFIEGTSIFGLGAGAVVTTDDEQAANDAVGKIQRAISRSRDVKVTPGQSGFSIQAKGAPIGAQVAIDDGKVVVAAGADTVDDVASPSESLADSDTFQAATDELGDDLTPSFYVNFAPILDLVDSFGESDPEIEAARPYLNAMDFLIAGSEVGDGRSTVAITLGVQDQPEGSDSTTSAAIVP
jgi:Protein of unknown function (DUF3352)